MNNDLDLLLHYSPSSFDPFPNYFIEVEHVDSDSIVLLRENRRLVTDEPVEVQDLARIITILEKSIAYTSNE